MQQVVINFEAGPVESYPTCREYVAALVHQQGKPQKAIAADMDISPSDLSRKLSPSGDDHRKFTLDDFEKFVTTTSDMRPIHYLIEKYLTSASPEYIAQLEAELQRLKGGKQLRAAS